MAPAAIGPLAFGEDQGTRFVTDQNGAFVQEVAYQPFGEVKASSGASPGTVVYTNKQWNGGDALAALGVSQLGFRIYDPVIGRFLSRDPMLTPRTAAMTNPYAFANNDPINNSDPSGLETEPTQEPDYCEGVCGGGPGGDIGDDIGDFAGDVAHEVKCIFANCDKPVNVSTIYDSYGDYDYADPGPAYGPWPVSTFGDAVPPLDPGRPRSVPNMNWEVDEEWINNTFDLPGKAADVLNHYTKNTRFVGPLSGFAAGVADFMQVGGAFVNLVVKGDARSLWHFGSVVTDTALMKAGHWGWAGLGVKKLGGHFRRESARHMREVDRRISKKLDGLNGKLDQLVNDMYSETTCAEATSCEQPYGPQWQPGDSSVITGPEPSRGFYPQQE